MQKCSRISQALEKMCRVYKKKKGRPWGRAQTLSKGKLISVTLESCLGSTILGSQWALNLALQMAPHTSRLSALLSAPFLQEFSSYS